MTKGEGITIMRPVLTVALCMTAMLAGHANAGGMPRPCGWLTGAEVSRALATKVTAIEDVKNLYTGKPTGCRYKTGYLMRSVAIDAYEAPGVTEAKRYFATVTQQAAARFAIGQNPPASITPVSTMGDQAADVRSELYVRKGAIVFWLLVFDNDQTTTPRSLAKAKALANAALGRL